MHFSVLQLIPIVLLLIPYLMTREKNRIIKPCLKAESRNKCTINTRIMANGTHDMHAEQTTGTKASRQRLG